MNADPDIGEPRQSSSTKWLWWGCGGGCLLLMLLMCGGVVGGGLWGYFWLSSTIDEFAKEFEAQGYQRVSGQMLDVTEEVTDKRVYVGQVVFLRKDVHDDIAVLAQACEIHGTVDGDIDFQGQVLTVQPNAVVKGNIRSKWAQIIDIKGRVDGEVSGEYQILQNPHAAKANADDLPPMIPEGEPAVPLPPAETPAEPKPESDRDSA